MDKTTPPIWGNHDFQSASISLAIWAFGGAYVGLGAFAEFYSVSFGEYLTLFGIHFVLFFGLWVSVFIRQEWPVRRYLSMLAYISGTSFAIYLTGDPFSPFFVMYIWIFLSFGTRYGQRHLTAASVASFVAYCGVLSWFSAWLDRPLQCFFFLLALFVLPMYQAVLLRKLHAAMLSTEEARRRAEQANQAKTVFLANMSHEVRTPMTGVLVIGDVLARTPLSEMQRRYVDAIRKSGRHLLAIVNDVLNLSQIESGHMVVNDEIFRLHAAVEEVIAVSETDAEERGIYLAQHIDSLVPAYVSGDMRALKQVLLNLLSNALKNTEKGTVTLRVVRKLAMNQQQQVIVRFEVIDTGVGMSLDEQAAIFERFHRGGYERLNRSGSTGLGLAISKRLVTLMGGDIGVYSSPGKGSTFWVDLPMEPADAPNFENEFTTHSREPRRILFVDDDPVSRLAGDSLLTQFGHDVTLASTGVEALEKLEHSVFDLMVVDVHMPEMGGEDLTRRIRTGRTRADVDLPIIGLTASVMPDEVALYQNAGMDQIITKPIQSDEFLKSIDEIPVLPIKRPA